MSSLRNAVKRVAHKERSQPEARQKMGLLEKHKDYVLRSRDYHKKQDYLKTLKKKAADRNPDEFYFKMHNAKVTNGVHKTIDSSKSLDTSVVKHFKTQDIGYLIHKKAVNEKKMDKMKSSLHMIGDKAVRSHKIFLDDAQQVEDFDLATHFGTTQALSKQAYNRVKVETIEKQVDSMPAPSASQLKKATDTRDKAYKELDKRSKRAANLDSTIKKLSDQKNVMGKGSKRKLSSSKDGEGESDAPAVYKWKRERLR